MDAPSKLRTFTTPPDPETLWMLECNDGLVRCAIHRTPDGLELRIRTTHRFPGGSEAATPDKWHDWLREQGWTEGVPVITLRPKPDRRQASMIPSPADQRAFGLESCG